MSKQRLNVVQTDIVKNRVGLSEVSYIIYTMNDGTYLMGKLLDIHPITDSEREYWLPDVVESD